MIDFRFQVVIVHEQGLRGVEPVVCQYMEYVERVGDHVFFEQESGMCILHYVERLHYGSVRGSIDEEMQIVVIQIRLVHHVIATHGRLERGRVVAQVVGKREV